jgi:Na+-transporting NADH:ubiquinone oxidoreductase subunit NqrB
MNQLDVRYYQIGALGLLLLYGLVWLRLDVSLLNALVLLATVLLTQYLCSDICRLPRFDPKSGLISGLSLCLLLRTNSLWLAALAGAIAIASKFLLRFNGKHLFNPTNFGIVLMMLLTQGAVWVSPGQWGNFAFFAFLVFCAGGLVVNRASRADMTVAFLLAWVALIFGRSLWLGEPWSIPLHRLQNGALLIFAFFMISDPKTTPNSRAGRMLFALIVAFGGWFVQFKLFRTNGLLWSLAVCSLAVPIIDLLLPGERYQWRKRALLPPVPTRSKSMKGNVYEPIPV